RLNIQNDVHHGWIAVFQREREEDCADSRASEAGENEVSQSARIDFGNLTQARDQNWEEHDQDEDMFPKDNHLGVKQCIKRDAPRALSPPERSAKTHQPGTISRAS